jgi:hypothetical protein
LATRLSQFQERGDFKEEALRLSALEERMDRLEAFFWRVAVPLPAAETATAPTSAAAQEERTQREQEIAALRVEMSVLRSATEPVTAPALTQLQNDLMKHKRSMGPL